MKEIITRINLRKLKNETHVQLNEILDAIFVKYNPVTQGFSLLYGLYKAALNSEAEALDFIRKSEITEKIHEQDRVRDDIYRGLVDSVKGATKHFDPAYREVAHLLDNIIDHYGNIARKTLDDETAAINDLVRELDQPAPAQALTLLGLTPWRNKLVEENETFTALMMNRYAEAAGKTPLRMRTARHETDKYYLAIVAQIENQYLAGVDINETFLRELNAVIERFKNILAQETGERQPKPADEGEQT
jgi:hypothetical protein